MKAKRLLTQTFSHMVYHDVAKSRHTLVHTNYLKYKAKERTARIQLLRESIPTGSSLIYRGSEGTDEVLSTMKSNRVGRKSTESRKAASHDIVGYIRDNDSRYFLSFTPCKETVKPYTVGLSLIPKIGYIFVTGIPKVYTTPQKLLLLNQGMFERYDKRMINSMPLDEARGYQSIVTMTRNNNEITGIIGASAKDDWRSEVNKRMHSVIEVCGPGRIASSFMSSSEPAHVKHWKNPDFMPELVALDIVFYESQEEYEEMNEKARDMGLIQKGERLPTFSDAEELVEQLDEWGDTYGSSETMKVTAFPKQIKPGDKRSLVEFLDEQIKSNPSITSLEEPRTSQTL
ncbi:hypothetical protein LEAN103870_06190 [Legionella anisa]|uniref:Uncharacterized protein n=1 Tax=Legionella anisa TaxID=28082 RepID=A0AAX0WPP5_9GAMM|nr:hypothetical protein [Legionella anisa]AWN75587.1 hypothetical protein DLD14_18060 [Legionella anisa]KTC76378.1 hypothetical protein Lani_0451 [Legionella anisa]MBN5935991.1 hypothetical protein [Legionella anisa]MCW8424219.1 hypothetical protein [Legionella anisa]MCW8446663.1 hypothetical protein [Legionella anisa]